ncbi:MAG: GTPase [Candidatus Helarchaeota archaeon]
MSNSTAILVYLKTNVHDHWNFLLHLAELKNLSRTLGYDVIDTIVQTRIKPTSSFLIGKGKLKELQEIIQSKDIQVVIFYQVLSSKQKLNLKRALSTLWDVEVFDRHELALKIFEQQATDKLSKIQIQMATLRKEFPFHKLRASIKYHEAGRTGVGRHGAGEYPFHSKVKSMNKRISNLQHQISIMKKKKLENLQKRKKILHGGKIVCICGFYNAGKTTLFNALTGLEKPVSDRPFTTLSSKYARSLKNSSSLMFVDTIGFILNFDISLIESFQLNVMDMVNADRVLLLTSLEDEEHLLKMKLRYGLKTLSRLGVEHDKILLVFNKLDLLQKTLSLGQKLDEIGKLNIDLPWIVISAKKRVNLNQLISLIENGKRDLALQASMELSEWHP